MLTPSPMRSPSLSSTTSPEMDADAELDPPVGRQARVALEHAVLHLDRAAHGVDHAAELGENAVSGALDDPPVMGGDGGIDQVAAHRPDPSERALFVAAGEAAKADDVGGQNRGELSRLGHEPVPRRAWEILARGRVSRETPSARRASQQAPFRELANARRPSPL